MPDKVSTIFILRRLQQTQLMSVVILRLRNDILIMYFDRHLSQGFQNVFAYGCPDRGREFDKK